MSTSQKSERALDERDEKILTSTEELIAEQGYDRVRLIDIADRSGVSIGSLQHRFRTRDGLLRATAARVASFELPGLLDLSSSVEDPFERMGLLLKHSLLADPRQPAALLWLELVVVSARDELLREILRGVDASWREAFEGTLERAFRQGELHSSLDARQISDVLIALIDGFNVQRLLDTGNPDPEKLLELALAVLRSLVEVS